jgi:hypothetical protein
MHVEGVVRIVPLFKSGDNIWNYRGIPILSAIPKIFEKLVCDVITDEQHVLIGGRSTVTSLVEFSYFVLSEMEEGLQVDSVYRHFKGFR